MKRVPYIEQMNQTECGLCCSLSILQYYGSKEKLLDLRNDIECGRDGYSFSKLRGLFESRGVSVNTYSAKSINALNKVKLPCIAFWDDEHFVVVYKLTAKHMYIMNPAVGYEKYDKLEASKHFCGPIMVLNLNENFEPRKSNVKSPWYEILKGISEKPLYLVLALVFALINYFIVITVPNFTSRLIDKSMETTSTASILGIVRIIIVLAVLYLLSFMARNTYVMISNVFFSKKIETHTFKHMLLLPYKFFEIRSSGDILYRMSSLSAFRELFTTQVISGIVDIGTMCFVLVFLVKKSLFLSAIAIMLSLLNVIFLFITREPIARSINNEVKEQAEMQSVENEALITISTIKTSGTEMQVFENWSMHLEKLLEKYRSRYSINNLYTSITGTFQMFAPIAILILGLNTYFKGEMSIGEVVAFQSMASILFSSQVSVFCSYTQFVLAAAYLTRVNDIWCEKEEEAYLRELQHEMKGKIELKNICFSYSKNSVNVIRNVSLEIQPGQRIAFVGKSGAGKSTIGKIISGLYEVEDGMLLFDDTDANLINKKSITNQVGIVPQEVFLLNRTIMDNIIMNDENLTKDDVEKVCRAVNIYDEIAQMPMGFQTIISEMGLNLSGGQRQRIALARALVHNPKIVVLDEATSALDSLNERNVTEYLKEIGCTQIIIAHRLSTIIDADQIYVMAEGRIVEQGTHEQLMALRGEYYELYISSKEE